MTIFGSGLVLLPARGQSMAGASVVARRPAHQEGRAEPLMAGYRIDTDDLEKLAREFTAAPAAVKREYRKAHRPSRVAPCSPVTAAAIRVEVRI